MSGPNDSNAQAPPQTLVRVAFYTEGDPQDDGDGYGTTSHIFQERAATLATPNYVFAADSVIDATAKLKALPSNVTISKVYFVGHGDDTGFWFNGDRDANGHFEDTTCTNPNADTAYLDNPSLGITVDLINIALDPATVYTVAPTLTISGGGGSGAQISIDIKNKITINNPGSGYTSAPTVTFATPGKFTGGNPMQITIGKPATLGADFAQELIKHLGNDFQVIFVACHTGNSLVGQMGQSLKGNKVAAGKVKGYKSWYVTVPTGDQNNPVFADELRSTPKQIIPGTKQRNNNLPDNAPYAVTKDVTK